MKGTLHWVSASHSINGEIRLYNHLFSIENPEEDNNNFIKNLNPNSLQIIPSAKLEPGLKKIDKSNYYQFLRNGYFYLDKNSKSNKIIFNRIIELKDNWSKKNKTY